MTINSFKLTDRDFAYKKLTENHFKSGELTFVFDHHQNYSLSTYHILENNVGKFCGTYLINENDNKIFVRLSTLSNNKKLLLSSNSAKNILVSLNYLECPLEEFIKLLTNNQFIIQDI